MILLVAAMLTTYAGLRAAMSGLAAEPPGVRVRVVPPPGGPSDQEGPLAARPNESAAAAGEPVTPAQGIAGATLPAGTPEATVEPSLPAMTTPSVRAAGVDGAIKPLAPINGAILEGTRIWVGGDSLSLYIGEAIYRAAEANGGIPVGDSPATHTGSGLLNSNIVDWSALGAQEMALASPAVAVFVMGANDAKQPLHEPAYAQRVGAMMDVLGDGGERRVAWVGAPIVSPDNAELYEAIPVVNAIVASEAAKRPWVTFVPTWDLLSGDDGYTAWLSDGGEGEIRVRDRDGIHLTPAGGQLVAAAVLAALN